MLGGDHRYMRWYVDASGPSKLVVIYTGGRQTDITWHNTGHLYSPRAPRCPYKCQRPSLPSAGAADTARALTRARHRGRVPGMGGGFQARPPRDGASGSRWHTWRGRGRGWGRGRGGRGLPRPR